MNSQTAYFRVDASQEIGIGHVMRCLTLADELRDQAWHCTFISSPETPTVASALYQSEYEVYPPDFCPAETDLLVVDHYGLDKEYEQSARKWAKSILVIDDLANRQHDCDILLDQTFGRDEQDYVPLTPKGAKILCGSEYALLRSEFAILRENSLNRRSDLTAIKSILISLGGTNLNNISTLMLTAFEYVEGCYDITVVLGSGSPFLNDVRDAMQRLVLNTKHKCGLVLDVADMAKLMAASDFAVGAGGTTSWERCCLGLPSAMIELAANQLTLSRNFSEANAALSLGWHENTKPEVIGQALKKALKDLEFVKELSQNSAKICDGLGAERVTKEIKRIVDIRKLIFRPATIEDVDIVFNWQTHIETRKYFHNPDPPNYDEHVHWFESKLNCADSQIFIAEKNRKPCGFVRLDYITKYGKDAYEVSILVSPDFYNQGIASYMLYHAHNYARNGNIYAEVKEENTASRKLFNKMGYRKIGNELYCFMNKYVVAATKSWNIENFQHFFPLYQGEWHLINTPEQLTSEKLAEINPRYIFFPHWSWKVPKEIVENYECVCFHMTDVPYGRGGSPLQNLIVREHKDTMLTALRMTHELDAGPVYHKVSLSLEGSADDILRRASKKSFEMIGEIVSEEPEPAEQHGDIVKFSRRTPDMSELPKNVSIGRLYDHVRMLDAEGYPAAFVNYGNFIFEFKKAELTDDFLECSVRIRIKEQKE